MYMYIHIVYVHVHTYTHICCTYIHNIPYSHQILPPLNFRPTGGRKLKGANCSPKLREGRKLKGVIWAPEIGGAKIKGNELVTGKGSI